MGRVQSGLRIPYDLNNALIQESKRQGFSKNALILQILRNWADSNGMNPALPSGGSNPPTTFPPVG